VQLEQLLHPRARTRPAEHVEPSPHTPDRPKPAVLPADERSALPRDSTTA